MRNYNNSLKMNAQTLRKNMTKEERHLWYDFLKTLSIPVKRQRPIGNYIVDFLVPSAMLVIELDGSQHFEDTGIKTDLQRDTYLKAQGYTVLRYANNVVNQNFDGVCQDILMHIGKDGIFKSQSSDHPSSGSLTRPTFPPKGGRHLKGDR